MTATNFDGAQFRRTFLLLFVVAISLVFFAMIRKFLVALLLGAIFSALAQPLYRLVLRLVRGRKSSAAVLCLLVLVVAVVVPAIVLVGVVTAQGVNIAENARPWIEQQLAQPNVLDAWLDRLPFAERIQPYQDQIVTKIGELAGSLGTLAVNMLAAATMKTVNFLFLAFVMLYAMFYFLRDGQAVLDRLAYYMPLGPEDEERMLAHFVSVSRATIKGTLVIGVIQGTLAGVAFWVAGIDGAVFWGVVMAVLSVIPGVGTALVWIPAVIYLFAVGKIVAAIALAVWCAGAVGTVDNVLRPVLVGRDTKMPDLLILVSTLGGLFLFGAAGLILGPIVAALFVTAWDIYGVAFKDVLPPTRPVPVQAGGGTGVGHAP